MSQSREQIAQSTAGKLAAAIPRLPSIKATIGFDGFVDEIIAAVDKRHDFQTYEPVKTIAAFGQRISQAAGKSSNIELVVKQTKLGGNGPIMANALMSAGLGVTYIGSLGYPQTHPVFDDMKKRAAKVISIADPGHTDALEFEDGKVMLGKLGTINDVNWGSIVSRVGLDAFKTMLSTSQLVACVNWTMIPYMDEIWAKMLELGLPARSKTPGTFFVDLADPEKRSHKDIVGCLETLSLFQKQIDVVLGLNLKEAGEIAEVLHLPIPGEPEAAIESIASSIREKLGLSCVVVHPRSGAAAATATQTARFAGPFVKQPKISTGAGDHFNAGFCLGRVLGFELAECLCTGCGTSGYYVRTAHSPTGQELADFIAALPAPQ